MSIKRWKCTLYFTLVLSCFQGYAHCSISEGVSRFKPPSYEGVFTPAIYDQSAILSRLQPLMASGSIKDEEVNQELLNHLLEIKKTQLGQKILRKIREEIKIVADQRDTTAQRTFWDNILGTAQGMPAIAQGATTAFFFAGSGAGAAGLGVALGSVGLSVLSTLSKALAQSVLNKTYPQAEVAELIAKCQLLENEVKAWLDGLENEGVDEFERDYVKKKRRIRSPVLQSKIEETLITLRKPPSEFSFIFRNFLQNSLRLPLTHKALLGPNRDESYGALIEKFNTHPFFSQCAAPVQKELRSLIGKLAYASVDSDDSIAPLRGRYYFSGNPGCGKSTAAEELAKFLGVPFYTVTIRDFSELTRDTLEGVDHYRTEANMGWMASPLTIPTVSGETFSNSFLIIDDFDRILFSEQKGGGALAFLLDYLDPRKRSFHSPYFGCALDISRMTVIITGNKPIPADGPDGVYSALLSRVRAINFPDLPGAQTAQILNEYIKTLKKRYHIPEELALSVHPTDSITSPYAIHVEAPLPESSALTLYGMHTYSLSDCFSRIPLMMASPTEGFSLRSCQGILETTVAEFQTKFSQEAQALYEHAQKVAETNSEEAIPPYQRAAIAGHAEAAYKLGEIFERSDTSLSREWYERASNQGAKEAAYQLAVLLQNTDRANAIKWCDRALRRDNHPEAAYLLGTLYERDDKPEEAYKWFKNAVERDHGAAHRWMEGWRQKNQGILWVQTLTPEQIADLTLVQIRELTPRSQIPLLTALQIQGVTPKQIQAFSLSQLQALIPTQISAFTSQQIESFKPQQISSLSSEQIQALTPESQLSKLTVHQVKALRPEQISVLRSEQQISALTPLQLQNFTRLQCQAMTPLQISALTSLQIMALSSRQLHALLAVQIQALTYNHLLRLMTDSSRALTAAQVSSLRPQQIAWLPVTMLTPLQMKALRADTQIRELTSEQIQALIASQIRALTISQIQGLTTEQIAALSPLQIQTLTPKEQIRALTPEQIQAWTSKEQITALLPAQIQALTVEQTVALRAKQRRMLTPTQIKALRPDQLLILEPIQHLQLSLWQLQAFQHLQLSLLQQFQAVHGSTQIQ